MCKMQYDIQSQDSIINQLFVLVKILKLNIKGNIKSQREDITFF